jgi:hypothetical protein
MRPAKDVPWEVELIWLRKTAGLLEVTTRCRGTMTTVLLYRTEAMITPLDILIDLHDSPTAGSWEFEDTVIDSLFQAENSKALHMIFSSAAGRADDLYSFLCPVTNQFTLINVPEGGFRLSPLPFDDDEGELEYLDQGIRKPCPTPPPAGDGIDWDATEDGLNHHTPFTRRELSVSDEDRAAIPRYSAADITFVDDDLSCGFHVTIQGKDARAKLLRRHGNLQREFECLCKITHSPYADTIRTTKLLGLVVDSETDMEMGSRWRWGSSRSIFQAPAAVASISGRCFATTGWPAFGRRGAGSELLIYGKPCGSCIRSAWFGVMRSWKMRWSIARLMRSLSYTLVLSPLAGRRLSGRNLLLPSKETNKDCRMSCGGWAWWIRYQFRVTVPRYLWNLGAAQWKRIGHSQRRRSAGKLPFKSGVWYAARVWVELTSD